MRLKNYALLAVSGMLTAGVASLSWLAANNDNMDSFGFKSEKPSGEHNEIGPALDYYRAVRANEITGTIEEAWVKAAMEQDSRLRLKNRASNLIWENLGPDNVGGRTRALLLDRDSQHLWFMGSVSGGLFRSNTTGASWKQINDQQENLGVTCIAQTIDGNIYYGTGEDGFTNGGGNKSGSPGFIGNGLYKSNDRGGNTFSRLPATIGDSRFTTCNSMAAHPTENKLYVATETGLMLINFTSTTPTISVVRGGACKEVKIDKNAVVWCSFSNGTVFKSTNGTTFSQQTYGGPSGRVAIAISPEDPNYVYLQNAQTRLNGLYRTTDGGSTWQLIVGYSSITDNMGTGQGYYDNVVCVDPQNKNRCYMGGVTLGVWEAGVGYTEIASLFGAPWNTSYVHADKHIITFETRINPPMMLVGCDGGLFGSRDRSTWTEMNRNFTTYQCYNVAANRLGHVLGGSQDNGSQLINFTGNTTDGKPSRSSFEVFGGDGFDSEFSRYHPKTLFVSTYYGRIVRSGNSGQSSSSFWDERIKPDAAAANPPDADFNTTYTLWEPNDTASRLFLARNSEVWVAINPTNFIEDVNWFRVAGSLGNDRIFELEHTAEGNNLFIAKAGRLFRLDGLNSATYTVAANPAGNQIPTGISIVNITPSAAVGRAITSVNVNQNNANHVVVTLGGYGNSVYVIETENALDPTPTWTNITGDLPQMPIYDALIDLDNSNRIILGTEFGVYMSTNGGTNWLPENTGMARVPVWEIRGYEWNTWEGMNIYIGTHGRGFYMTKSLTSSVKKTKANPVTINSFPVPARDVINIDFNYVARENVTVEVFGMNGSRYITQNVAALSGKNSMKINTEKLPNGYYFVKVYGKSGSQSVKINVIH